MHRGDRRSSSSRVKPPAHPIRFVSPAAAFATTDTILKSAILVALLREAFPERCFSFDAGFASLRDILATRAGRKTGLSHFVAQEKDFFAQTNRNN